MSAEVEKFIGLTKLIMSYFKDIDMWLDNLLAPLPEPEREGAKREIKEKILESYRNGLAARKEGADGAPRESAGRPKEWSTDFAALHAALDELGHVFGEIEKKLNSEKHDAGTEHDRRDSSRGLPDSAPRYRKRNR